MRIVEPISAEIVLRDFAAIKQALMNPHLSRTFDKRSYADGNVREGVVSIMHGQAHRDRRRLENMQFRPDILKLYERDHCRLPQYTEDILNISVLKEALDKLNLDNWSNEEEFRAFEAMTTLIKDAFYLKITPPTQYLKSIVQELEA